MTKRSMHTIYDQDRKGYSRFVTYEIGEMIRWPKNGNNLLRAIILEDRKTHWLVVDRHNKQHLAWKGCIVPL
jgi:hypothetical protein